jgi:hypothetical protein
MIDVEFENLRIVENENIHILDLDITNHKTLTNKASNELFKMLCEQFNLNSSKRIFLYHTDGLVTEWDDGFKFVTPENEKLLYKW